MKQKRKIPYSVKKSLYGYGFIGLWIFGTVIFFLIPLVKSLIYSFSEVTIDSGKIIIEYVGFEKYIKVLTEDEKYTEYLTDMLIETLWKTPVIIIFSLFIAVVLNQKFRGRTFARAVFFLPVIIVTGSAYKIITGNINSSGNNDIANFSTVFSTDFMGDFFEFIGVYGVSDRINNFISAVADNIYGIVWNSGIQILLFLSALQNIPTSVREASLIDGATAWEFFWKITVPYIKPFIIANIIFTVIDTFTNPLNTVMERISVMRNQWAFGEASAMAWVYFALIMLITSITVILFNKRSD
ncbi:MAG: sugar ABC transporter permease [Prevotella sp.]|nr:sugar ABC transporter permease [Alistipes senegalensis]MCM1358481.1 sugar ABC transporter permease [Prevotella sp.]MCM1473053.1 sugar ABC transporter permease [Muribaculaceae bacterium]